MILTIWNEVQLQWAVRNAVKHGDTDNTRFGAKIAQVLRETEDLYRLKPSTLPSDQVVFHPSLAIHQASLTTYTDRRAWVNTGVPQSFAVSKTQQSKALRISKPLTYTLHEQKERSKRIIPFDHNK
jgi:hypothetical protein